MIGKYKLAHIGGIAREHEHVFRACEKYLTMNGYICFAPVFYSLNDYYKAPEMLDDMCYAKLCICDLFVIATPDHIGKSTSLRIKQAKEMNIPIYIWTGTDIQSYKE